MVIDCKAFHIKILSKQFSAEGKIVAKKLLIALFGTKINILYTIIWNVNIALSLHLSNSQFLKSTLCQRASTKTKLVTTRLWAKQ